jgi:hypothetical protein
MMIDSLAFQKRPEHLFRARNLDELPGSLQRLAEPSLKAGDPPQTILFTPRQVVPRHYGSAKGEQSLPGQALIFTAQGLLHLQEDASPEQAGSATYLAGNSLLYTHLSLVLLYGRLELFGIGQEGPARMVVVFNTVSHFMLQPALERLLRLSWGEAYPESAEETASRFVCGYDQATIKYQNGLENYLLKFDRRLLGCVVQPPIAGRLFGILPRRVAPPVLLALTEHQLAWIEEGITNATRYAYYITYCPRRCVEGFEYERKPAWQEMLVHLRRDGLTAQRRTRLEDPAVQDWQAFWAGAARN